MKRLSILGLGLFLLVALFQCQSVDNEADYVLISLDSDSSYSDFHLLKVSWVDSAKRDTVILYRDSVRGPEDLRRLRLDTQPSGSAIILIQGYGSEDTALSVYRELRNYQVTLRQLSSRVIELDIAKGISQAPEIVKLTGDTAARIGDTVDFEAEAADKDGLIAGVVWYFGASRQNWNGTEKPMAHGTYRTRWKFTETGSQPVTLEVTDNSGKKTSRTRFISIRGDGKPRIAWIGLPDSITMGDTVTWRAAISDDEGQLTGYAWDNEGDGRFEQGLLLEAREDTVSLIRTYPDTGTYRVGLRVLNSSRIEARDLATVRVILDKPWADAGHDTVVTVGDSLRLSGKGGDRFGRIIAYAWKTPTTEFVDKDSGLWADRAPRDTGVWPFILRVTDDDHISSFDTVWVRTVLSDNANLERLSLSQGNLIPGFSKSLANYSASVPYSVSTLRLGILAENPRSTISVSGTPLTPGDTAAEVTLVQGNNTLIILVVSENGHNQNTYTLNVFRRSNDDAALSALSVSQPGMEPNFHPDTLRYRLLVPYAISSLSLTPHARDGGFASMRIGELALTSGKPSPPLTIPVGDTTLFIEVTAQNGTSKRTYSILVSRQPQIDASLSSLSISAGTLDPGFSSTVLKYRVEIPNSVNRVAVTPIAQSPLASLFVDGKPVKSGLSSDSLALAIGDNTATVVVKGIGPDSTVYRLIFHRRSSEARLRSLIADKGLLKPGFDPDLSNYSDTVGASIDSMTIRALADSSADSISIGGYAVDSFESTVKVSLAVGANSFPISVTAEDGQRKTYSFTVYRLSNDTRLKDLAASSGTLSPEYQSNVRQYRITVPQAVPGLRIMASPYSAKATVKLNGAFLPPSQLSDSLSLAIGSNPFRITVIAESGDSSIYSLDIRRLSANARLKSLVVSRGQLFPAFSPTVVSYEDTVSDSGVTITAISADTSVQSITINALTFTGDSASRGLILARGKNLIPLSIQAEDGSTQSYSIAFYYRPSFQKAFGTASGNDHAYCMQPLPDGGFIIGGAVNPSGGSDYEAFLTRTDVDGNVMAGWPRFFNPRSGTDVAYAVAGMADNGFLTTGYSVSGSGALGDALFLRTNSQGTLPSGWPMLIDSTNSKDDVGYSLIPLANGGYFVVGSSTAGTSSNRTLFVMKLDAQGQVQAGWPKSYATGAISEVGNSVRQLPDGGFVIAGSSIPAGGSSTWYLTVYRLDSAGNMLAGWPKIYDALAPSARSDVQVLTDGGFAISTTRLSNAGDREAALYLLNGNGTLRPNSPSSYGGAKEDQALSLVLLPDGDLILAGSTNSMGAGGWDVFAVRTHADGMVRPGWPRTFGGASDDYGFSIQRTADGAIAIVGYSFSFGGGDQVFLVKTDP